MKKFTMKFALIALFVGLFSSSLWADGLENFDNSNATSSYADNSFVGEDGITWTYIASRDANNDANGSGIDLPALMLRRSSDNSKVSSSTISGGIASFSVKLYKGFTGGGNRQVELFINDVSKGTSTAFDDFDEHTFTVDDINVTGDIVIEIRNITSKQVIVDDITWTSYAASTTCDVTFQVNMQNEVVSGDGVHLAGNFAPEGQPGYWDPAGNEMTDGDFDGIYEVTLTLDKSTDYQFKYVNGDSWDAPDVPETVPDACATDGNRTVTVGDNNTQTLDVVCFGECVACNILDWYNLQWPGTADILSTENETIFARAYEAGVTDALGNEDMIECWIGYSTENTDPSTWTDWVVATFNEPNGANYEYMADLGADQSLVGTYYYASRFSYNSGDYTYGGFNAGGGDAWDGTTNVSGVLNVTAVATIPYAQTFAASIGDWITYSVASDRDWSHTDDYMKANGFGGNEASDDYLISPIFNLDNYSNEYISFDSWTNYTDAIAGLELLYTTNYTGDPATTTWETLNPTLPNQDTEEWTGSGNVDISGIAGTAVRFAFHYETTGTGSGTTTDWRVKNVVLGTAAPATSTWTGTTNNDWATATNWDNGVPGATTDVTIPASLTNYPTISAAASANTIAIAEGATLLGSENLTLTGDATFTQSLSGGADVYHMISAPVFEPTAISVFPATSFVRSYDETTTNWVNLTGADPLEKAVGYSLNIPEAGPHSITYTGALNTATVSSGALSLTGAIVDYSGWHLLGNPFAAALDFDLGTWNLSNVEASLNVWDGANGNYITSGGGLTDNIIPVGQAFFVKATVAGGSIDIPLDACVHNSTSVYKENRTNYFALNITNDANSYSDNTFVRFGQAYANEYDAQDATKMYGLAAAPQIYTMEAEHKLKINSRRSAESIDLNFEAGVEATYTFTVSEFSIDGKVMLEDKVNDITVELEGASTYEFTAMPSDPANRFVLHFDGLTAVEDMALEGINVYAANDVIYVNNAASEAAEITVFSITGQKLMSTTAAQGLNSLRINGASGNYLVQVKNASGIMTEKVFVQ